MSVPALLHGFILRERCYIDNTIRSALPKTKTAHFKRDTPVTRVLQGCYVSVPALLHGFILREIDVTLITQYVRPYLRLKLHILSVTLLLHECYRAVT